MRVPTKEGLLSAGACIFIIMVGSSVDGNIVKLLIGIAGGVGVSSLINYMNARGRKGDVG